MRPDAIIPLNRCLAAAPAKDRPGIDVLMTISRKARDIKIWPDRVTIVERSGVRHDAYFADGKVITTLPDARPVQMKLF